MLFTTEAVMALAPDASSAKSARGLARTPQWPLLGGNEQALWGECQGSGSKPYQTQVDLSGPAFKCSCPSRKFPCKHGLGLMLLKAEQPQAFSPSEAPAWVTEWVSGRQEKAQKKEQKQAEAVSAPPDPEAAQKRAAKRWDRILQATQDLQRFLHDQLDQGLGSASPDAPKAWASQAARMVDAQAPGLAQRLRDIAQGLGQGSDWPERTLARIGLLHLACEALQRRESLDSAAQADLQALVGWPLDRAEVQAQGVTVSDTALVLGVARQELEGRLTEQRSWLWLHQAQQWACVTEHAHGGQGFAHTWPVGLHLQVTLAFYPGHAPLRAMVIQAEAADDLSRAHTPATARSWADVAQRLSRNPWQSRQPVWLTGAKLAWQDEDLTMLSGGHAIATHLPGLAGWELQACTGGQAINVLCEWVEERLHPLSAWLAGSDQLLWQRTST